jgi:EpsI family protein
LGTLYAYLICTTFYGRLVVVLVSAGAAIMVNVLRVFIVVYFGFITDMQHPLLNDHLYFGWYLFGGLVVVLLIIDALLHRSSGVYSSNKTEDAVEAKPVPCNKGKLQLMASVLVVAIFTSAGPGIIFLASDQPKSDGHPVKIELPSSAAGWAYMQADEDGWTPLYRGAIADKMAFHDKNHRVIHLYLGIYTTQSQGTELINDLNRISDDKIWHIKYQRTKVYNFNGQPVLEQLLEKNDGTQRLVWYWYRVAGQNTINKYQAKALQVLGVLKGMQQASVVAIATKLDGEPEDARKILGRFAEEVGAAIDSVIDARI